MVTSSPPIFPKIDVYSFGVVLVELITKIKPTDNTKNIVERFVRFSAKEKAIRELFDPDVTNAGSMKILESIGKIAKECLQEKVDWRPEMNIVAGRLRELRATLEEAKEKALKKWDQRNTNNIAARSALHVIRNLGIFSRVAPNSRKNTVLEYLPAGGPRRFSYVELKAATKDFSDVVGRGPFGTVYRGELPDQRAVAVKQLHGVGGGEAELWAEVTIIGRMHHLNQVRMWGFCADWDQRMLVYEYVPNGSLDKYLFVTPACSNGEAEAGGDDANNQNQQEQAPLLDLHTRYGIALGVARAIAYLHEECLAWVHHCDIKPENILLDDDFCPKVSDSGLFKLIRGIRGTSGYMAPEWVIHREPIITAKAEVYSFGMVLMEIVSGRRNYGFRQDSVGSEDWYFPKWAYEKVYVERRIDDILDPRIAASYDDAASVATVERMVKTAMWCLQDREEMRPSMGKVAKMLEGSVEITEPVKPTIFCVQDD